MATLSFPTLEIVQHIDTWPFFQEDPDAYKTLMNDFYYFMITGFSKPFGYVLKQVVDSIPWPDSWNVDHENRRIIMTAGETFEQRTKAMHDALWNGHGAQASSSLRDWRNELFPLVSADGEHVLDLDGCGLDLLGIVTAGLHVTAWTSTEKGRMYWIQKRSDKKEWYPGMLDTAVGGGHRSRESPIDGMIREIGEESGLDETYARGLLRPCGALSYCMSTNNYGDRGCQHHIQYVFEMELPLDVKLVPTDGEVEKFRLATTEEVLEALAKHEFKPQSVMVWIAHFIRHGTINAENEPDLVEVCARLHRKHDFFVV